MLKEQAIRKERYEYGGAKKQVQTVYIFLCTKCSKEMRVQSYVIARHKGLCKACIRIHKITPPYTSIFKRMKGRAEESGMEASLTFEEFVEFTKIKNCVYCNAPITWIPHNEGHDQTKLVRASVYNLDRKDSSRGYSKDNVVVCCGKCNFLKRDLPFKEFMLCCRIRQAIKEIYGLNS